MKKWTIIVAAILVIALIAAFTLYAAPQDVKKVKATTETKVEKKSCGSCTACGDTAKKIEEKKEAAKSCCATKVEAKKECCADKKADEKCEACKAKKK